MNALIHRLCMCSGAGIRRIRERLRTRSPRRPLPLAASPEPPAPPHGPLPAHVAARWHPLDGDAVALVRPYLRAHEGAGHV
jgi:hypothetical protein